MYRNKFFQTQKKTSRWHRLMVAIGLVVLLGGLSFFSLTHVLAQRQHHGRDRHHQTSVAQSPDSSVVSTTVPSVAPVVQSTTSLSTPIPTTSPTAAIADNQTTESLTVPVLMYHYVRTVTDPKDKLGFRLSVTPTDFDRQMDYLVQQGYQTVTPSDLINTFKTHQKLPTKSVLLTFDDGYADFYATAYPILQRYHLKATLYVVTGFVGRADGQYVTWDQITEMDRSGLITMGAHTVHHVDLTKTTDANLEITQSKKTLEEKLGHPVDNFAYPAGRFNDAIVTLVKQAGFGVAFTTKPGQKLRSDKLRELPRVRVSGDESFNQFTLSLGN